MKQVRIIATKPDIDITVPMGDGPATITTGLGGWTTVERVEDTALTAWEGQAPLQQDIPLMLDGFATNDSVEQELNTIFKLGGRDNGGHSRIPPIFKVFGPVHFEGTRWVLPEGGIDLDTEGVIRRDDGELLRQPLTLHLLEWVDPQQVKREKFKRNDDIGGIGNPGRTGGTAFPGGTYTTKQGDTLVKIAAQIYGDWQKWKEIAKKNDINDPHRKLPAGKTLQLP